MFIWIYLMNVFIQKSCHYQWALASSFSYIKKVDRKLIKNYQPISLLCVDYKIIAETMAKKINNVMHKVVLDNQICFNPSWNINENIITFLEVQDYMHNFQKPTFAFLANIENRFICICRRFLQAFLEKIKLWFYFIFWFLTLNNK